MDSVRNCASWRVVALGFLLCATICLSFPCPLVASPVLPTGLLLHQQIQQARTPEQANGIPWQFSWVVPHHAFSSDQHPDATTMFCSPHLEGRGQHANDSGAVQRAYQLQVWTVQGSQERKMGELMWDSGKVISSQSSFVFGFHSPKASDICRHRSRTMRSSTGPLQGFHLSDEPIFLTWRVRVWLGPSNIPSAADGTGCLTMWSEFKEATPWCVRFTPSTQPIWHPKQDATYTMFLKQVHLPAEFGSIQRAYAFLTGALDSTSHDGEQRLLGSYRFWVNGRAVSVGPGRGYVPAGETSWQGNLLYDVVNVSSSVWASGKDNGSILFALQSRHQPVGAFVAAQVALFNGSHTLIVGTDSTWLSYNADDIYVPGLPDTCGRVNENIDVRQTQKLGGATHWRLPGFEPSDAWVPAVEVEGVNPPLTSLPAKSTLPLQVQEDITPVLAPLLTSGAGCTFFFDFGAEYMSGLLIEFLDGTAGEVVVVKLSEQLNGTHHVLYPESSSNHYLSVYTLADGGGSAEHHEYPGLWRYGEVQYANRAECATGKVPFTVKRWQVHYPFRDEDSAFTSANSMLNRVWDLNKQSLKVTSLDTFTDSNTRERLPYEADGWITAMSRWALQREYAWPRHSAAHVIQNPTWPTEWKQFDILLAFWDYMETGVPSLVRDDHVFELMVNNTMLPFIHAESHLVNWTGLVSSHHFGSLCHKDPANPYSVPLSTSCDIVDWPPNYRAGYQFTVVNTVVNSFAARSLAMLATLANATGRTAQARALQTQSDRTYSAIRAQLFDVSQGLFCDGVCAVSSHASYHAQHFPLWLGVLEAESKEAHRVVEYLYQQGMVGSVYAASSLLRGLYDHAPFDQGKLALQLLTSCESHSWCTMLRHNATATWETWSPTGGTHSHPWSSTPASVVASGFMGIRPLEPGFGRWEARPQSGGVEHASITRPTIKGPIHSSLNHTVQHSGDGLVVERYELQCSVPGNTRARLCVPQLGPSRVGPQVVLNGQLQQAYVLHGQHLCVDVGSASAHQPHRLVREVVRRKAGVTF